eukprot:10191190-Heterocapsa_arctica.AAC.1
MDQAMDDNVSVLRTSWTTEDIIPAEFMENLVCEARSMRMRDTEWYDDYGDTEWRCCKNPRCYRCGLIDMTEMDVTQLEEKGIT